MKNSETETLFVVEKFFSIQGESSFVGLPCYFVRMAGCNLRCNWCDTTYSYNQEEATPFHIDTLMDEISSNEKIRLIEFTGGEPLLQMDPVLKMCRKLASNYQVLIETNGSISIKEFRRAPKNVRVIMDIKTPSSGMHDMMYWDNVKYLRPVDEVKFVVRNRDDFDYACEIVNKLSLNEICGLIISPCYGEIELPELAEWVLGQGIFFRMQVQLHKIIWGATKRGV